jgi:DNA-binding transcriptional ArsR family regulator
MTSLSSRLAVTIAKEGPFYNMGSLIQAVGQRGDPISRGEVAGALYSLSRQGDVQLREHDGRLVYVEATKKGYADAGVPVKKIAAQVGHTQNLPSLHPGDLTDFRNQPRTTTGGPVTKSKVAPSELPLNMPLKQRITNGHIVGERVLRAVLDNASGAFTPQEMADRTEYAKTTVAYALRVLEDRGLIIRLTEPGKGHKQRFALSSQAASVALSSPPSSPRKNGADAPIGPAPVAPKASDYPELQALRQRARKAKEVMDVVEHLLAAAAYINDQSLLDRATELEAEAGLSPMEAEYLRYVAEHS